MTDTLSRLGFTKYRTLARDITTTVHGFVLPKSFMDFLECSEPPNMPLNFRFTHLSGEEWEGQVAEFVGICPHPDDFEWLESQVTVRDGHAYLPIACDSGGNYIYIVLSKPQGPVVDVEYSTGAFSEVAPSFSSFLEKLYHSDV